MNIQKGLKHDVIVVGWAEWCALPTFKVPLIKAKIDTGAKTSSLHAFDIVRTRQNGKDYVKFSIHPVQANDKIALNQKAQLLDERYVMSSNGHREKRYVVSTMLSLAGHQWEIELTLANRDALRYRLLLGREALANHVAIFPNRQCVTGSVSQAELARVYRKHR